MTIMIDLRPALYWSAIPEFELRFHIRELIRQKDVSGQLMEVPSLNPEDPVHAAFLKLSGMLREAGTLKENYNYNPLIKHTFQCPDDPTLYKISGDSLKIAKALKVALQSKEIDEKAITKILDSDESFNKIKNHLALQKDVPPAAIIAKKEYEEEKNFRRKVPRKPIAGEMLLVLLP